MRHGKPGQEKLFMRSRLYCMYINKRVESGNVPEVEGTDFFDNKTRIILANECYVYIPTHVLQYIYF